ncbi:MAG: hypothetical protein A2086_06485 [Spirochaetes bacterium GWD1_27_9]|nr:MAG: hypothetical protein A2Z98_14715 [Spirochaetes bacterium GWB1_27_13]OHD24828.1 MAG: hypothetical protein A2Y34_08320 [Spirochaetes bacterium GWC1_27_15]OHD40652.1 MAG: hypothetical protein A2086_06485 [Spirochaetes bacterium GWD1_27_9]
MKFYYMIIIAIFFIVLFSCELPQTNRVDDKITDYTEKIQNLHLPSKLMLLGNSLFVLDKNTPDKPNGVYKYDLSTTDGKFLSSTPLLIKPYQGYTFYNKRTSSLQTEGGYQTIDFDLTTDSGKTYLFSIVRLKFDPDGDNTDFVESYWYYIYKYNITDNISDPVVPLTSLPVSQDDTNYDTSSFIANYISVVKNGIYLSCSGRDTSVRFIKLEDNYTINAYFKPDGFGDINARVFAKDVVSPFNLITKQKKNFNYIFVSSKDRDGDTPNGLVVYRDEFKDNDTGELSTDTTPPEKLSTITFHGDSYPNNFFVSPDNTNQIYCPTEKGIFRIDVTDVTNDTINNSITVESTNNLISEENAGNVYIFKDEYNTFQKGLNKKYLVQTKYNPNSIPDSTELKIRELDNLNSVVKTILVSGVVNNMVYYKGRLIISNQSFGTLISYLL